MIGKIKQAYKIARLHGPEFYKATKLWLKPDSGLQYPDVINLLANDICNSKCTMCNIWQQKLDFEISPEQLFQILKNPLYKKVKRIGVTGGEPTMREDLPQLYDAACRALPQLVGMSIITNAIKEKDVIARIEQVYEVLKSHGKTFNIMVSLDGVGEVHDRHRGRPGNFDTAMNVINHFRDSTDIPVIVGCTITKGNVWDMDEMLDFMIENKIHGRFRMGEFIQRLYNDDLVDEIRNFSRDEVYHLLCFYERLIRDFEKNPKYIRTYRSIQNVLQGKNRSIGCPYQGKGVVLDSRGEILYCAPKSSVLGSALDHSAEDIYFGEKQEMDRIMKEHCSDCIHDYHAHPTWQELKQVYRKDFWRMLTGIYTSKIAMPFIKPIKESTVENDILIAGWYGTETVGDKAILAGIVQYFQKKYGYQTKFTIASIHPYVTQRTMKELELDVKVIPVYSREFINACYNSKELVMGGGPLMDMESMAIPHMIIKLGKKFQKKTIIFGCGLGPLNKDKYIGVTKYILKEADEVLLRDRASISLAEKWTGRSDIKYSGDPAANYIRKIHEEISLPVKKNILACFLREWPEVYAQDVEDFEKQRTKIEKNIADQIKELCSEFHLTPAFYSMHTFVVGGDDRQFYRRFIKEYFQDQDYHFDISPATVSQTVQHMLSSSMNLCMRFHSVLMAKELNTQFMAIDYTGGGKIMGLLRDADMMDRYVDIRTLSTSTGPSLFHKITA